MNKEHTYKIKTVWTGNNGEGTSSYVAYDREHTISILNKPDLICSADTPFRGNGTKHNPEDFLVSALSACHMLWFLHLCADAGVIVTAYTDEAEGTLILPSDSSGHFKQVTLKPHVIVKEISMKEKAMELHSMANKKCFIANSVNFPVYHQPQILSEV